MAELDLSPMFPASLSMTGETQTLRRPERSRDGEHRVWYVVPRYGTANSDRWTLVGVPHPAMSNPAAELEDGQFPDLRTTYMALVRAELLDDGTNEED